MSRVVVNDTPATPHFDFLAGAFRLSHWTIPYMSASISLTDAAESLHLAPELPGAERIAWRVDELYQRDINWPRVERTIVPYLNAENSPQFFNSLTIALLPYDPEASEIVGGFTDEVIWKPPALLEPSRFARELNVGPISLGYWTDWQETTDPGFASGQIRWNPTQVFGVAIDGQHRLAAIKSLVESGAPTSRLRDSQIPVILLIFDPRVGYGAPANERPVDVLRRLFIDLNKHAQTVSRARQILLDDQDPHAVCVRRLVGEQLADGLGELQLSPPQTSLESDRLAF